MKRFSINILILTLLASFLIMPCFAAEKPKVNLPQPVQTEEELVKPDGTSTSAPEDIKEPAGESYKGAESQIGEKVQIVTAIAIDGNSSIPSDQIKNIMITKIGEPALEPKLIRDRRAILDMGYFSDVNYYQVPFAEGIKVTFKVLENPIVSKITISGNKIVPTDKILAMMETKEGKILNNKVLSSDLSIIRNYYDEEMGFVYPNHIEDITWTQDGQINIKVKEAMVIKEVKITGNKTFSTEALRKIINIKEGDLLSKKVLAKDLTSLLDFYKNKDYFANIQQPQIDFENGIVSINVAEVTVEDVQISGNEKTKTAFLKRILKLKAGDKLRSEGLLRDNKQLQEMQLFDNVEIETEQGSAPDKYIIVWKVKEPKKYNFFTFGIGYGAGGVSATSRTGLSGGITANIRNIKGKGQSASANWQRGYNIDTWALSFYNPAINNRADQLGLSIFNSTYRGLRQPVYGTDPVQYAYYDDKRNGGTVSFGRWLGLDLKGIVALRREAVALNENATSTIMPVGLSSGSLNAVSLTGIYDTRDDIFNPYKGYYINASGQFVGGVLRGNYNYDKYQGEVRKYFPLKKERSIAFRLWGGAISGVSPAMEYFYVGGTDTLRAYDDNSIFGTRMYMANAEYRFPVGKIDLLKGAVFADAGNAWSPGQSNVMKKDVGVGLRLVFQKIGLAIGIIRIDYAVKGQGSGRFSIGMGQSF